MQLNSKLFNFILPTKVEFGPGAIDLLPDELARSELHNAAFIVTAGRERSAASACAGLQRLGVRQEDEISGRPGAWEARIRALAEEALRPIRNPR